MIKRVIEREVSERADDLESSLGATPGVRKVRIDLTSAAGISNLQVLALPEATDEEVRGAIVRAAAGFGVDIKSEAIEVLRSTRTGGSAEPGQRRRLSSLSLNRTEDSFTAKVALELIGDVLIGESESPAGPRFEGKAVAQAVINGLRPVIGTELQVDAVAIQENGAQRLATVSLQNAVDEEDLVGSAVVVSDEHDAIARATLNALNRRLGDRLIRLDD
jgi:hypothetical protein